jgi:hypothetical protein
MILLPLDLRERLLANGRHRGLDHLPIVKLFHPIGAYALLLEGKTVLDLAPVPLIKGLQESYAF